jgi:hypothetical protein
MKKGDEMRLRTLRFVAVAIFLLALRGSSLYGQQAGKTDTRLQAESVTASPSALSGNSGAQPEVSPFETGKPKNNLTTTTAANSPTAEAAKPKPAPVPAGPHKLGPFNVTVNWRFRTEAWDWFQPPAGQNAYAFEHSLLKIGIGQKSEAFEWLLEGAADAIVDLPPGAVQPGRLGQLGLGGTYFVANGNARNNVNGFVKQAYVGFKLPAKGRLKLGRFTFLDGAEVQPKDKTLATLVNARVAQRLIGDFGFSAVQRSFDGAQLGFNAGNNNITLFGARPTRGVYQNDGMGELSVDVFYGAFTHSINSKKNAGSLRVFAVGYVDERGTVLKTDNRTVAARTADNFNIRIGTYGADYAHVIHTDHAGQFNFLLWGALQSGGWGVLTQRAGAFVGEAGWQPKVRVINPWFSAGYSFGSGDSNPNDNTHNSFFQLLPTPRGYDRFPFYNMMNNEDYYGSAMFRLPRSFAIRSELHALCLANANDLWYGGGGAFQPKTFGYTGRASGGARSLANVWDVSLDVPLRYGFSITTYYAHAWGKSVIASIYPAGTNAQFGYVETNFRF